MDDRRKGWEQGVELKEVHATTTMATSKEDKEFYDEVLTLALRDLPQKIQQVMRYYFGGLNTEMIITRMGGNTATVNAQIKKYRPIVEKKMGLFAQRYI